MRVLQQYVRRLPRRTPPASLLDVYCTYLDGVQRETRDDGTGAAHATGQKVGQERRLLLGHVADVMWLAIVVSGWVSRQPPGTDWSPHGAQSLSQGLGR